MGPSHDSAGTNVLFGKPRGAGCSPAGTMKDARTFLGRPALGDVPVGEQFAVLMFFEDGNRRYVCRFISAQEARRAFEHCIRSVEARFGIPMRVVITDRYDCILREWQFGKGITFPPEDLPQ
jgi:hypothetical protein